MTKKKSGFLTFCFSLIPGAGEMYMGFMKQGVSVMAAFFGAIFIASYFYVTPLLMVLPIIWFYSFFNVHNLRGMSDEEFYALEDDYLLHLDRIFPQDKRSRKQSNILAGILILIGTGILWKNLMGYLEEYVSSWLYWSLVNDVPQFVIALIFIVIGVMLIRGKKADLEKEEEETV